MDGSSIALASGSSKYKAGRSSSHKQKSIPKGSERKGSRDYHPTRRLIKTPKVQESGLTALTVTSAMLGGVGFFAALVALVFLALRRRQNKKGKEQGTVISDDLPMDHTEDVAPNAVESSFVDDDGDVDVL
jgi:hypothetical protein